MALPFRRTSSTVRRIEVTESTVRRIDPAEVAKALGAEPTGDRVPPAGPLSLYALRSELYRRRVSSGGRPGIAGTDQRVKIPVSDQDWAQLEELASKLASTGASPSPGQVASVLLSLALESIKANPGPAWERDTPTIAQKLAEKVSSRT
ncbi:MAG: hypothetical protein J2P46_01865 [Zavarzinella sp.]|nr:hypothetical protein [Zavarzinella sp.]